jgi:hypothetical protein
MIFSNQYLVNSPSGAAAKTFCPPLRFPVIRTPALLLNPKAGPRRKRSHAAMGSQDAPGGGSVGKLSLSFASVGLAGAGSGAGGYKDLLVMALPRDDGLDDAKVAEVIGVRLPDVGGAVRVRKHLCLSISVVWLL